MLSLRNNSYISVHESLQSILCCELLKEGVIEGVEGLFVYQVSAEDKFSSVAYRSSLTS